MPARLLAKAGITLQEANKNKNRGRKRPQIDPKADWKWLLNRSPQGVWAPIESRSELNWPSVQTVEGTFGIAFSLRIDFGGSGDQSWQEKSILECLGGILKASWGIWKASESVLEASWGILLRS